MIEGNEFFRELKNGRNMFFVHIPKTAGSTLVEHFRKNFPEISDFYYAKEAKTAFENSNLSQYDTSIRVSGGHYYLSHLMEGGMPNASYLSFIRHPVKRIVSYYKFSRRSGFKDRTAEAARNNDFAGFLEWLRESRHRILNNQQCRFLATTSKVSSDPKIKYDDLGILDSNIPLFLSRMENCSNVCKRIERQVSQKEDRPLENMKVSKSTEKFEIPPQCLEIIQDNNQEDFKLFNHVYKK